MTMPSYVFVEPLGDGWIVRGDAVDSPLEFTAGARAEQAARELCHSLSDAGEPVVLEIRLRNGERGGRFLFPAYPADPSVPVALRA